MDTHSVPGVVPSAAMVTLVAFSKPLRYEDVGVDGGPDGFAASAAMGMDATANVAMRADPVARLASRRLVMKDMM